MRLLGLFLQCYNVQLARRVGTREVTGRPDHLTHGGAGNDSFRCPLALLDWALRDCVRGESEIRGPRRGMRGSESGMTTGGIFNQKNRTAANKCRDRGGSVGDRLRVRLIRTITRLKLGVSRRLLCSMETGQWPRLMRYLIPLSYAVAPVAVSRN